jgi:hypothetical protein
MKVLTRKLEVLGSVHRDDVDVHVRNLEPLNHQAYSERLEELTLGSGNSLRHSKQVLHQLRFEVGPIFDLDFGNDQGVAVAERMDGEEGHARVVLVDEVSRNLALDNSSKQAGHTKGVRIRFPEVLGRSACGRDLHPVILCILEG